MNLLHPRESNQTKIGIHFRDPVCPSTQHVDQGLLVRNSAWNADPGAAPPPSNQLPKLRDLWRSPPGSGRLWSCLPSPGFLERRGTARDLLYARGFTEIPTSAQFPNCKNNVTAISLQNIKIYIKLRLPGHLPTHSSFFFFKLSGRFHVSSFFGGKKFLLYLFLFKKCNIFSYLRIMIFLKFNIRFYLLLK